MKKKIEVEIVKEQTVEDIESQRIEQEEMFQELDDAIKNMKVESEVNYEV